MKLQFPKNWVDKTSESLDAKIAIVGTQQRERIMKYGSFEAHPCIYNDYEGWVLFPGDKREWCKLPIAEIHQYTKIMTEEEFKAYGCLPPLPSEAFSEL
jgi:hypothetical protein